MDPADTDSFRQALSAQGALVGHHGRALQEIMDSLQTLNTRVTQLSGLLDQVSTHLPSVPSAAKPSSSENTVPSAAPVTTFREPHMPTPERYSGELGSCGRFLLQCSLVFDQQPTTFASDKSKIAFVVSLLSGRAAQWATALWERESQITLNYPQFVAEIRKIFDHPVRGREAANRLLTLRQGSRSVSDYAIEFRILAAESGWDEVSLQGVFSHGLADFIKDELVVRDESRSLDNLISLATCLDNRIRERRREKASRPLTPTLPPQFRSNSRNSPESPLSPSTPPTSPSGEEPMQLGRARLTQAERQRRFKGGLCLYCGLPGHHLSTCPSLPKD